MEKIIQLIKQGKIFVYPTDTIYGLGCNALNKNSVNKIKKIKSRDKKPFSIISPSKSWIYKYTKANKKIIDKYLPGKYTLILEKKNKKFLNHVSSTEYLGIRIPDNDFCKIIQSSGVPFITTSVNLSGKPFAKSVKSIDKKILNKVDVIITNSSDRSLGDRKNCRAIFFCIDSGKLSGKPSTIILSNGKRLIR